VVEDYFNVNLIWALLCISTLVISLILNASGAPGNWLMLIVASFYAFLMPNESPYDFGLIVLGLVLVFAIIGEILEFFTGAISTKKAGGTKRGIWFSVIGSIMGSIVGIFVGIPIPIIGSLIAALLFSGVGALLGAYYGEKVEGKSSHDAWKVGISSFTGRILGSIFKIICGFIALICMSIAMLV
tara:strand:- start:195 stop:749 length:555 start_codon:yes stop_codon:yes gene_type:complete